MRKKVAIGVLSITSIGIISLMAAPLSSDNQLKVTASDCSHVGVEYYAEEEPMGTYKGHIGHYACCKCHTAWSDGFLTNEIGNTLEDRSQLDFFNVTYTKVYTSSDSFTRRVFNDELLLPTKSGYIFDCWLDTNNNIVTTINTEGMTLVAKWLKGDAIVGDFIYSFDSSNHTASLTGYVGNNKNITIPSQVEYEAENYEIVSLGASCFEGSSIMTVVMPNTITEIKGRAFFGCSSLNAITLSSAITSIDYYAFYGCSQLSSIDLPDTLTFLGRSAFNGCPARTTSNNCYIVDGWIVGHNISNYATASSLTIPYGPIGIAEDVFVQFYNATSLSISSKIKYICKDNFSEFKNLKTLSIPANVELFESSLYRCDSLTTISIGAGLRTFYPPRTSVVLVETVTVNASNPYLKATNNILYSKDGKNLIYFPAHHIHSNNSVVTVDSGVERICSYAFAQQNTIYGRLVIPDNVRVIEPYGVSYIRNSATVRCETPDTWSAYTDQEFSNLVNNNIAATDLVANQQYYLVRNVA